MIQPRRASMVHALLDNADRGSDAPRTIFALGPDEHSELRHDVLAQEALGAAAILADAGIRRTDRIVLCLPTSPEFVVAFFGAVLLGATPVAIAGPGQFGVLGDFAIRYQELADELRPRAVITRAPVIEALAGVTARDVTLLDGAALRVAANDPAVSGAPVIPRHDDLAYLQLTSGSTSTPTAVMISHGNVAANCEQLGRSCAWGDADIQVAWLPLNHDMGLVGTLLAPLFLRTDSVLLPPERFVRSPAEWLRAVTRYRGTLSAAPNFAFGYTAARVRDTEIEGVDLSSWRFIFCGAEPISPRTVGHFVDRFGRWGLRADALVPCYGLAEATLGVTVATPHSPLRYDTVSRAVLAAERRAVDVDEHDPEAQLVVDCGAPVDGTEVRIVGDEGNPVPENTVGRIQFRGSSTTAGYFQRPDATSLALDAHGWWDTGDVGYLRDGRLRVAGRAKEVIIIRGANYFPADFEHAAETVAGVRAGGVVALGVYDQSLGTESLHLIVETEAQPDQHAQLRSAIVAAVTRRTGVVPAAVHLRPRRSIPKTSSGKSRRLESRRLLAHHRESREGAGYG